MVGFLTSSFGIPTSSFGMLRYGTLRYGTHCDGFGCVRAYPDCLEALGHGAGDPDADADATVNLQ